MTILSRDPKVQDGYRQGLGSLRTHVASVLGNLLTHIPWFMTAGTM